MTARDPDSLHRLLMLREAVASTALSHSPTCQCTVCLAADGDERAMAVILARIQRLELDHGDQFERDAIGRPR